MVQEQGACELSPIYPIFFEGNMAVLCASTSLTDVVVRKCKCICGCMCVCVVSVIRIYEGGGVCVHERDGGGGGGEEGSAAQGMERV